MACGGNCCASDQANAAPAAQARFEEEIPTRCATDVPDGGTVRSSPPSCESLSSIPTDQGGRCSRTSLQEKTPSKPCCSAKTPKTGSSLEIVPMETLGQNCCSEELQAISGDTTYSTEAPQSNQVELPFSDLSSSGCCSSGSSEQGCCTSRKKHNTAVDVLELIPKVNHRVDVEKSGTGKEHIILSISGMTCTGCETKLQRTLATLPHVSNLRTSLILARAEFDLDIGAANVEEIVKHLSRTTEFKCEQVSNQGSSLDLVCPGNSAEIASGDWPLGVTSVKPLDKNTIRVEYDAKVIGARDLLDRGWQGSMLLAPVRPDPTLDAGNRHVWHMCFMTMLSAILTIPVLIMAWAPLPEREIAYGSASLVLATIVQVVVAGPFYPKAIKALVFSRVIEMDLLIVLSTTAAYVFSVVSFGYLVAGHPLSTGEFFETSTLLVTLIMVGRWVASLARQKAAESISIRSLQTPTAILVESGGSDREIDARLLQYGDIFKVAPDSQVPTDGTVIAGLSEINESMLTGESKPVVKYPGFSLIAGSINGTGMLTVRLTHLPGDNTITTIATMVDEAKLSKPRIQDIADKIASYFVPVVVTLTVITFVIWIAVGMTFRKQSGSEAAIEAITYAITVLIVSCPCAIGLAVPMVIVVASGIAARHGVIFKSANSMEVAYKTTDVVFDKTGTLTLGQLKVVEESYLEDDIALQKSMLLGLLANIKHPVSVAVESHLVAQGITTLPVQDAKVLTGKGVEGVWQGKALQAGNASWLNLGQDPRVQLLQSQGLSVLCFTVNSVIVAIYGLQDALRPDAASTISKLLQRGMTVHILSGDNEGTVQAVASQLGVTSNNTRSQCSPSDKRLYIEHLQSGRIPNSLSGQHKPVVMFIGDGTNDAVALAQATIGIHMSSGTDIAQSAADVVLMRSDLSGILTTLAISKKAMHRVAFNFGWSFVYNLFAVLLGAGAFVHVRIPPEFAGLGELVSVLPVIAAAVLLRWSKI